MMDTITKLVQIVLVVIVIPLTVIDAWIIISTFGYGVLLIWLLSVVSLVMWIIENEQEIRRIENLLEVRKKEYPMLNESNKIGYTADCVLSDKFIPKPGYCKCIRRC